MFLQARLILTVSPSRAVNTALAAITHTTGTRAENWIIIWQRPRFYIWRSCILPMLSGECVMDQNRSVNFSRDSIYIVYVKTEQPREIGKLKKKWINKIKKLNSSLFIDYKLFRASSAALNEYSALDNRSHKSSHTSPALKIHQIGFKTTFTIAYNIIYNIRSRRFNFVYIFFTVRLGYSLLLGHNI